MHDAWAFARLYQIVWTGTQFVIRTYNDLKGAKTLADITHGGRNPVKIGVAGLNLVVPQERWIPMMVPYEQLDESTRNLDQVPANVFKSFHYNAPRIERYPFSNSSNANIIEYATYITLTIKPVIERALGFLHDDQRLTLLYKHARIQDFIYGLYGGRAISFAEKHASQLELDLRNVKIDNTIIQNELASYASENVDAMIGLIESEPTGGGTAMKSMVRKCNDGRSRKVFRVPGKGNTLYARYLGRDVPVKSIPKKS